MSEIDMDQVSWWGHIEPPAERFGAAGDVPPVETEATWPEWDRFVSTRIDDSLLDEHGPGDGLADLPVAVPTDEVTVGAAELPVEEPAEARLEEPMEEPAEARLEQPMEEPVEPRLEEPVEPPLEEPIEKPPVDGPAEPPVEAPVEAPAEPPVDAPADPPMEGPAEPPVEAPAEPPVDPPADPPADSPVEAPVDAPAEPPVEGPAVPPVDAPADPPVEAPVDGPVEPPVEPPVEAPADPPVDPAQDGSRLDSGPDGKSHWFLQAADGYCLPASVAQIVSEYSGRHYADESEFVATANQLGLFVTDDAGNPAMQLDSAVTLLEKAGVPARVEIGSLDALTAAIAEGRGVIAAVDSGEYWFGETAEDGNADHAVVVTGVDVAQGTVTLSDPGIPNGDGARVPIALFEDAWRDSGYAMVACDQPASDAPQGLGARDLANGEASTDDRVRSAAITAATHREPGWLWLPFVLRPRDG